MKKIFAGFFVSMLLLSGTAHAGVKDYILGPFNVLGKAFQDFSLCLIGAASDTATGTVGTAKSLYGAVTAQDLSENK